MGERIKLRSHFGPGNQINNKENMFYKTNKTVSLAKLETMALQNLMNRNDIIICNADKGGGVVILGVEVYIQEAMEQLNDTNHYKQLPTDPTMLHCGLVNSTIEDF